MSKKAIEYLESIKSIDETIYFDIASKVSTVNFDKFKRSHIAGLTKHKEDSRSYNTHLNRVRKLYIDLNKKP